MKESFCSVLNTRERAPPSTQKRVIEFLALFVLSLSLLPEKIQTCDYSLLLNRLEPSLCNRWKWEEKQQSFSTIPPPQGLFLFRDLKVPFLLLPPAPFAGPRCHIIITLNPFHSCFFSQGENAKKKEQKRIITLCNPSRKKNLFRVGLNR